MTNIVMEHEPINIHNKLLGNGIRNNRFYRISATAASLWRKMGHGKTSCEILLVQLRKYKTQQPYDTLYTPAKKRRLPSGNLL